MATEHFFHQLFQSINSLIDIVKFFNHMFSACNLYKNSRSIIYQMILYCSTMETFINDFSILEQFSQFPVRILFIIRFVNSFDCISFRNISASITGFSNVAIATATRSSSSSLNRKRDIVSA